MHKALKKRLDIANKATLGPWIQCSANYNKCICKTIWSTYADSPVCEVSQKWGDINPETHELIEYGEIPEKEFQSNKEFISLNDPENIKLMIDAIDFARKEFEYHKLENSLSVLNVILDKLKM